jgi:hypothetical protein
MASGSSARKDQTKTLGPALCCKMSIQSLRITVVALLQKIFLMVCNYFVVKFLRKGEDQNKSECPKLCICIYYQSQFGVNAIGCRKHNLFKLTISLLIPTVNCSRMFSTGVISFATENTN